MQIAEQNKKSYWNKYFSHSHITQEKLLGNTNQISFLFKYLRIQCSQSKFLLFFRIFCFLFIQISLLLSVTISRKPEIWFFYLSHLACISLKFYFLICIIIYASIKGKYRHAFESACPIVYCVLIEWLIALNVVYHLLIPIVFWTLLFPQKLKNSEMTKEKLFVEISLHAIAPMMIFIELALSNIPVRAGSCVIVLMVLFLYLGFAYLGAHIFRTFNGKPQWPYPFLNFYQSKNFIILFFIGIIATIAFFTVKYLHQWKIKKTIE